MRREYWIAGGAVAAWCWWKSRQPAKASDTKPAQSSWLEHAPESPTDFGLDMWARINGADLFPYGKHPVATASKATQDVKTGIYVDPTNAGGAVLSANAPPYQATVVNPDPFAVIGGN